MPRVTGPVPGERDVVGELARIGYARARRLLILMGLVILALVVVGLLARSVDHVEVIGTLLFVPVFLALMFWGVPGGAIAGVLATAAYVVLRGDAIDAVGWGEFAGVVVSRGLGYLLFGVAGGWASSTLEASLDKLDLYDTIDDQTGIHNARFLINDVGLEAARSERYESVFSVSFVEIPAAEIDALSARKRRQLLRDLGRRLEAGVRTIDRVAHGYDGRIHHVAAILPETAAEGAAIFHGRLKTQLTEFLSSHDVDVLLHGEVCTVPGQSEALEARLDTWRRIDSVEHAS